MKTPLFSIALFFLLVPLAQAADVPELEEWFSILNQDIGYVMSYLPDFDTAHEGKNAVAVRVGGHTPTWYNRYKGDTTNQFEWSYVVRNAVKADMDGDGVEEYLTSYGTIHKGLANGSPPEQKITANYNNAGIVSDQPYVVTDVDGDGYNDIVSNTSYRSGGHWLLSILFGGSDLQKLKITIVEQRKVNTEFLVGVLPQKSAEGKVRIVTRSYQDTGFQQPKWVSYVLREIEVDPDGDSMKVSLTTLDSITDAQMRPQYNYGMFAGAIHQSRPEQPVFLLVPVEWKSTLEVYNISEGRFKKTQEFRPWDERIYPHSLNKSINGDVYRDYFLSGGDLTVLYTGGRGETLDSIPIGKMTFICAVGEAIKTEAIGDVTGDGVGDIATSFNNDHGCFIIHKGIPSHTVGVAEPQPGVSLPPTFSMQQNYPNPIGAERRMTVPVEIQKAENFTLELYTLDGRKIAELFNGFMPVGKLEFTFDLKQYNLSAGFYSLRLSNGVRLRERGVLLR